MNKADIKRAKASILRCLTEDFEYGKDNEKRNQAIFDAKEGWAWFHGTDLEMVMDKVVLGLYFTLDEKQNPTVANDGV